MSRIDPTADDPAANEVDVGPTGTWDIEALAMQPGTGQLFAANGGQLGRVGPDGRFVALGSPVGRGTGAEGSIELDDLDGLSFDPASGALYTARRRPGAPDLLARLDPTSGPLVPGAMADGADYVAITAVRGLDDVGDLAVEPETGRLYAVANRYGGEEDVLVSVDRRSGG